MDLDRKRELLRGVARPVVGGSPALPPPGPLEPSPLGSPREEAPPAPLDRKLDALRGVSTPVAGPPPAAPILEVSGQGLLEEAARRWVLVRPLVVGAAPLLAAAAGATCLLPGLGLWPPWMPRSFLAVLLVPCLAVAIALGLVVLLGELLVARTSRVIFHEDRLLVLHPGVDCDAAPVVRWDQLRGFDDGSGDYIRLETDRVSGLRSYRLTVPTPTEAQRLSVLELLERKGIPRLG